MTDRSSGIKKRWAGAGGVDLRHSIQQWLRGRGELEGLDLSRHNGRLDLRGIAFTADLTDVEGMSLSDVDLTGANVANINWTNCTIENCLFDKANCQFWQIHGTSFSECSFQRADLRNCRLGEWYMGRPPLFAHANFSHAKFRHSSTHAAVYEDCDFSFADLKEMNFWQSSLIRCKFAGDLHGVVFDGRILGEAKPDPNPMLDVDFTEAEFHGVEFRGVRFDAVALPDDSDLVLVRDPGGHRASSIQCF